MLQTETLEQSEQLFQGYISSAGAQRLIARSRELEKEGAGKVAEKVIKPSA